MNPSEDEVTGTGESFSFPPIGVVVFRDNSNSLPTPSTSTCASSVTSMNEDEVDRKNISTRSFPRINLSPNRAPPLPSSGGFSLQPRRNIPIMSPSPSSHASQRNNGGSSASSRGRKRGSQSLASSALSSYYSTVPRALFSPVSCASNHSHALPPRHLSQFESSYENNIASPTPMHHALQSMSIRSPFASSPSPSSQTSRRKESSSFVLLSPSSRFSSSYRPRSGSESFVPLDCSTQMNPALLQVNQTEEGKKHSRRNGEIDNEVEAGTRTTAFTPSTPSKCGSMKILRGNTDAILSTPQSHTTKTCYTPGTPVSVRTLPSPHDTPLPRSMRLTPRRTPRRSVDRGGLSSDTSLSMFLSPNESQKDSSRNDRTGGIISFEGAIGPLQQERQPLVSRSSSYIPSPFSCSRSSVTSRMELTSPADRGGSRNLRVETRSLFGPQDSSNTTLDFMDAANARAAALNCDNGSLSDDENDESFVLANPVTLAQEQDSMSMPPPRPSRRRRITPPLDDGNNIPETNVASSTMNQCDHLTSSTTSLVGLAFNQSQEDMPESTSGHARVDEENLSPKLTLDGNEDDSSYPPKITGTGLKMAVGNYDHKYFDWLKTIESYSSMAGLDLEPSSFSSHDSKGRETNGTSLDANGRPYTPPLMKDGSLTPLSNTCVRISRSDADNVHLTIAKMAAAHEHCSPGLMVL
mmetsp:Transcript_41107/g.44580  ORF Transcript_41107/g.44580 Transcript_41107/m.44580 type:complete len:694 (+) Transcript_41107:141-2222(+)